MTARAFAHSPAPFRRNSHIVRILGKYRLDLASRLVYLVPATLAGVAYLLIYAGGLIFPDRDKPLWASAPAPWTLLAFATFFVAFQALALRALSRAPKAMPILLLLLVDVVPWTVMIFVVPSLSYGTNPVAMVIAALVAVYGFVWSAWAWQWPKVREFALADAAPPASAGSHNNPAA